MDLSIKKKGGELELAKLSKYKNMLPKNYGEPNFPSKLLGMFPLFNASNLTITAEKPKMKRGKIWTYEELKMPKASNCKYCGCKLKNAKWQRMHMCKGCFKAKKMFKPIFADRA